MLHDNAASPAPIRVAVLADVRLYREGLARVLASYEGISVVGAGPAGDDASVWLRSAAPDVILIDGASACETTIVSDLLRAAPDARIVAYGVRDETDQPLRCAELGVSAFVPGEASDDDLVQIIRGSARGELLCSPRIASLLVGRVRTLAQAQAQHLPSRELTMREEGIVALIADGLSNKEIALRLGIELCTVKNHVHHILDKLQVSRRTQAVARLRHMAAHRERRDPGRGSGS